MELLSKIIIKEYQNIQKSKAAASWINVVKIENIKCAEDSFANKWALLFVFLAVSCPAWANSFSPKSVYLSDFSLTLFQMINSLVSCRWICLNLKTSERTKMTSKNRAWIETYFHILASEMVLHLCVIKIKMFIFLPCSLCNIFSVLKMSRAEFTLPLMPSFFFPSCFITAAWTAANSNCTFALHCFGLCCTFNLTRLFNVDDWADRLKLQPGNCTPQDAHTSHLTALSLHRLISLTSGRGSTANSVKPCLLSVPEA